MSKPTKHMISIQWGTGMHYLTGGADNAEKALASAMMVAGGLQATIDGRVQKRGSLPTVYLWEMKAEIPIKRSKQ